MKWGMAIRNPLNGFEPFVLNYNRLAPGLVCISSPLVVLNGNGLNASMTLPISTVLNDVLPKMVMLRWTPIRPCPQAHWNRPIWRQVARWLRLMPS